MNHPLIENYIYEVSRRLSGKEKEDILEELRANICDMLPNDPTEEEIIEVLNQLGDPAALASQYPQGQRYLISPMIYDEYVTAIKWIVPVVAAVLAGIGLLVGFLGAFGDGFSVFRLITNPFVNALSVGLSGAFHALFWTTLGFIVAERLGFTDDVKKGVSQLDYLGREEVKKRFKQMEDFDEQELKESIQRKIERFSRWDAGDLSKEEVPKKSKHRIPLSDSIAELVIGVFFGVSFLLYLLDLLPWVSFVVLDGVRILNIFTAEFIAVAIPITLVIILLTIYEGIIKITIRKWTPFVGTSVVITSLISAGLMFFALLSRDVFQAEFIQVMMNHMNAPILHWVLQNLTRIITGGILIGTMFEIAVALYHTVMTYIREEE